jgi:trk system potassium uptake protein
MRKQVLVIGLGQFGMAVAGSLSRRGVDVLAVDLNPNIVQEAAEFCAQAVVFDASDEEALARTEPSRRDVCLCAIGPEARESSIICTALLRQMGAPRIIARASDDLHARILKLVGANEVVNPERAFGERLAARLAFSGMIDELPLGTDLMLTEIKVPPVFVGRNLIELALPRRFKVTLIAIRQTSEDGKGAIRQPSPKDPLVAGDILILAGGPGAVAEMLQRI